jgi:sarcosine oxidase subunit gamma
MLDAVEAKRVGTSAPGTAIHALAPEARLALRLDPAELGLVGSFVGRMLDIPINRQIALGSCRAARLGPDEWLFFGPAEKADLILRELEATLAGRHHACVDISHRNVGFELSGPHAGAVLNAGCPLDLSADAFPSGAATRTLLGKAEIVLLRLDDAPRYRIECWRSFGRYVHDFLLAAAAEFNHSGR